MVENDLAKNMKQASIKDFLSKMFNGDSIDDIPSNIAEAFCHSNLLLFFCINGSLLIKIG